MIPFSVFATLLYVSGLGVRVEINEHFDLAAKADKADKGIIGKVIIDKSLAGWCLSHAKQCRAGGGAIKPLRKNPILSEDEFRTGLYIDLVAREWRSRELNGWLGLTNIKSEHRLMVEWERPAWYAKMGAWDVEHPGFITVWTPASIETTSVGRLLIGDEVSSISYGDLIPKDISLLVHRYVGKQWQDSAAIIKNFQRNSWVYHAAALLTWLDKDGRDPGFVTMVELDFVNGLALRVSKNAYVWSYEEPQNELWAAIKTQHPFMHAPAQPKYSELNVWDLPMDASTFRSFFKEAGVRQGRWEDPHMTKPVQVKTQINRHQVMESLWRYVQNKPQYNAASDNCQTFIADFVRSLNPDKEVDIYGVGTDPLDFIAQAFRTFYMSYTPRPELFTKTPE